MKLSTRHIDYLNIGLILISLILAYLLPFKLFMFAYAVLGPLHYLTEINWLNEKSYFVNSRKLIWTFCIFAILFSFPYLFSLPTLNKFAENETLNSVIQFFWSHINALIFMAIIISISMVFSKNIFVRGAIISGGFLLSILLNTSAFYNVWIGLFIPTVIHVFVFTILFMIYGALKISSIPGFIAAVMTLIVPFIILLIDVNPKNYIFSDLIKQTFLSTDFHVVNAKLSGLIGSSDGDHFFFYEKPYLKIQIFLAFAYTYHYLNWFSKTSIIGWYKKMNTKRSLIIFILWAVSMGIYWYDYQTGFLILLALSLLHVFAEFPLNIISIKGILNSFSSK